MPLAQTFETTIFRPAIRIAAEAFVLPKSAFDAIRGKSPRQQRRSGLI